MGEQRKQSESRNLLIPAPFSSGTLLQSRSFYAVPVSRRSCSRPEERCHIPVNLPGHRFSGVPGAAFGNPEHMVRVFEAFIRVKACGSIGIGLSRADHSLCQALSVTPYTAVLPQYNHAGNTIRKTMKFPLLPQTDRRKPHSRRPRSGRRTRYNRSCPAYP